MPALPVTKDEFASLINKLGPFGPDDPRSPLALAVSGGGDSLALAYLARGWRKHIIAFIVDHALRVESRQEAELTQKRLEAMGVPAHILTLDSLKTGGLQERARDARFAILERACKNAGATALVLAHHEADQEETMWMRVEKKSGKSGLTGIAPRLYRGRIALIRPFLSTRPERLKETLRQANIAWCEDPSNHNRRFKRVQLRQDLTDLERHEMRSLQVKSVLDYRRDENDVAELLARHASWQAEGWIILESKALSVDDHNISQNLLGRLISLVGGNPYIPSRAQLAMLKENEQGTLGGVIVKKQLSHNFKGRRDYKEPKTNLLFMREKRSLEGFCPAKSGQLWDNRWLYLGPDRTDCQIGPLGEKALSLRVNREVPAAVLKTVPALWHKGTVVSVAEGVRGLIKDLPRENFSWESRVIVTGSRLF
ncbi:tRNA lysidine(34) synthetase TilS [Aristophania vespae]|uniref:tRNA lysidine(34) synthetase TilS n=1 Tax=Aristophania vespae TaxID=2697033 RepID=UPI002351928B|nr:tRNA lysidine(34) synthetase TilS [Aristophania vespae]